MDDNNSQEEESKYLEKFFSKYMCCYNNQEEKDKCIDKIKRNKCCTFFFVYLSVYIPHNTIIFIIHRFLYKEKDKDGYLVKLIVLLLCITLFITFNMTTEFTFSYFYQKWWVEESISNTKLVLTIIFSFFIYSDCSY